MNSIGIVKTKIWYKSYKLLIAELEDYFTLNNPYIILNFGGDVPTNSNKIILNNRIGHIKDKITMNRLLDEGSIPHPKTFYFPFEDLPKTKDRCVIKKRFSERGKFIIFTRFNKIDKVIKLTNDMYVQYFIPFEREYRIGIDFKRILGVREKIGLARCRNSKTCNYATVRDNERLEKFAKEVFDKFKLDFCGIDIGEYNGNYYIIEINSAPTIGEVWAKKLANDLKKLYEKMKNARK